MPATASLGQMESQLRSHGFTLVELIAVLILLGILGAVFIPRSSNDAIIVSTQAEQFAADIRYVQSLAMTQGWSGVAPLRYHVDFVTATTYRFSEVNSLSVAHPGGTSGSIAFTGGVSISPFPIPGLPSSLVSFDGLGRPLTDAAIPGTRLASTATISLIRGGVTRTVQIVPETGMVRVQ